MLIKCSGTAKPHRPNRIRINGHHRASLHTKKNRVNKRKGSAKKRTRTANKRVTFKQVKRDSHFQAKLCRITEKMIQTYLARTGGTSDQPKQVIYKDVVLGQGLTPEQVQVARTLVKMYEDIFMKKSPDDIPPPLDVEPVEW